MQEVLRRLLGEVWSEERLDALPALIAPRYTILHDPGDPWEGRTLDLEGYQARLRTSRAPFPDQRFTIVDLLSADDRAVVTWTWRGTHLADLPGLPATGRVVAMSGATTYAFDRGRVASHWQVVDRLGLWRQLQS